MQKTVTYHSSAVLYNDMLAERAREAAEAVEHPLVKQWCEGIAKQHEFHAKRHRSRLSKLERAAENHSTELVIENPVAPVDAEGDTTTDEDVAEWQRLEAQAHADLLAAEQQKES